MIFIPRRLLISKVVLLKNNAHAFTCLHELTVTYGLGEMEKEISLLNKEDDVSSLQVNLSDDVSWIN